MKAIGLQPTDTEEEGGKETGDRVHHLIVPGDLFDRVATSLLARGFRISWTERPLTAPNASGGATGEAVSLSGESKSGKRVKYVCPVEACGQTLWAKHEARFHCSDHMTPMIPSA